MPDIKAALTRKVGPLPAYAWGAVAVGGFVVYRLVSGGGGGSTSTVLGAGSGAIGTTLPDLGPGGSSGDVAGGDGIPVPGTINAAATLSRVTETDAGDIITDTIDVEGPPGSVFDAIKDWWAAHPLPVVNPTPIPPVVTPPPVSVPPVPVIPPIPLPGLPFPTPGPKGPNAPTPTPNQSAWGSNIATAMSRKYDPVYIARALRSVGVTSWGTTINPVDIQKGLKAAGINYGNVADNRDIDALLRKAKIDPAKAVKPGYVA